MTLGIDSHKTLRLDPQYNSQDFRDVLEDHMDILRVNGLNDTLRVSIVDKDKWSGDFSGLLAEKGIDPNLHWVTLRMNGFRNFNVNLGDIEFIIIPDSSVIEGYLERFKTARTLI